MSDEIPIGPGNPSGEYGIRRRKQKAESELAAPAGSAKYAILKLWDGTYTVAELIEKCRPDEAWPWRDVYQPIAPAMPHQQASNLYEAVSGDSPSSVLSDQVAKTKFANDVDKET